MEFRHIFEIKEIGQLCFSCLHHNEAETLPGNRRAKQDMLCRYIMVRPLHGGSIPPISTRKNISALLGAFVFWGGVGASELIHSRAESNDRSHVPSGRARWAGKRLRAKRTSDLVCRFFCFDHVRPIIGLVTRYVDSPLGILGVDML